MSNLSDDIFSSTIAGMILGLPILIGIAILSIPFVIISGATGVPMHILLKNFLAFAIALFIIWLLSRYQIIENGMIGLIVGLAAHTYWGWHSFACVLIGVAVVGILFFISYIKIGFWIKTILFSATVTFIVFMTLYSDTGLLPMQDKIWKSAFAVLFFLENIFIRCSVAYGNGFLIGGHGKCKNEEYHNEAGQAESVSEDSYDESKNQANTFWFAGINNAEELKKRYKELMKIYHPDNQAGDTNAVQQIQSEYEELLKRY